MLEIGSLVGGKYRILNKIGQGGMSVVYLAINERANKTWAVKEVRKDGVMDSKAVEQQLVVETNILMNLKHKYLPSIVDVIEDDASFIMVMDYVEGLPLNDKLKSGALNPEDVVTWSVQLAQVLYYLHSQTPPIIYRDMKPANVMLKPDGDITLIDFGAARKFKEGNLEDTTSFGSPQYAAPEQFAGRQTDERTDIYGLGATMYHLLTGIAPPGGVFPVPSIRETDPSLPAGLDSIINKCTQPDPERRYQNANELIYDLEHWDEIDVAYRRKQKRKLGAFAAAAALTLLFAATSVWGYASAEGKKRENYDYILRNASSVQEYYDAILTDPTRTEAYLGGNDAEGLVDFLLADESLSSEDNAALVKLRGGLDEKDSRGYSTTTNVLSELETADPTGYAEVCNAIGEAYLFYYDVGVEKDKYAAAAAWFQYAQDEYPAAKMYCDINDCLQNIARYSKSEQFAKLYEEYASLWSQIKTLQMDAENYDDDLRLRVWNEIVSMIRNNASQLCEVADKDDILRLLDTIVDKSGDVTNTFLQDSIQTIQSNIETTRSKIESVRIGQEYAEA